MGNYYAQAQGEDEAVAAAIEDHYKPLGPDDRVPTDPVSVAVALADKIDILVGFWAIDEKPTGSKDPVCVAARGAGRDPVVLSNESAPICASCELPRATLAQSNNRPGIARRKDSRIQRSRSVDALTLDCAFFADRLKVQLREQGARHDLVDAVFALEGQDDLLLIVRRVEALGKFLDTDDGKNLLAGTKRAANILRIEEKKDNKSYTGAPDATLLSRPRKRSSPARSTLPKRRPPRRSPRRILPPP